MTPVEQSLKITIPQRFRFETAVRGHGWCDLDPFSFDPERPSLVAVLRVDGRPVRVDIRKEGGFLELTVDRRLRSLAPIASAVRHVLRMDEDFSEFYRTVRGKDGFDWIPRRGAGRLLRSQTVFEDLVKTICTTNCSWSLTKIMVSNLVTHLGDRSPSGAIAFPTPRSVAARGERFFREVVRAGYRAPHFPRLARDVVAGKIDPERWLDPSIPTAELKREIKSVKGVGDYAAENMLKLLGRYDGLALDSWLRSGFAKKHNRGRRCDDRKIEKFYERFGKWKGLVLWCDMTERWF